MTTNPDLDQAREWAESVGKIEGLIGTRAAVEVIQSLPDQWIDAEKVRLLLDRWAAKPFPTSDEVAVLNDVEALLAPDPQPRTLADMTPEEREACQWAQADHQDERCIITRIYSKGMGLEPGTVRLLMADGTTKWVNQSEVIPLPDLPRLEWPASEPVTEEDVSIIPPEIDTSTGHDDDVDMTPEDVPEGEVWIVECYGDRHVGTRDPNEAPNWALARMDGADTTFADDELVTLASRMVPEGERA